MKTVAQYRFTTDNFLKSSRYRYGDLYGISFLHSFKKEIWTVTPVIKTDFCNLPKSVNLFCICDSYLWSFVKSETIFCSVKSYIFSRWGFDGPMEIRLDTSQINVLLIEIAERFLRITPQSNFIDKIKFLKNTSQSSYNKGIIQIMTADLSINKEEFMHIYNRIYNPNINQNLEFNLSDYLIFTPLKEMKAWLNFKLFGQVPQELSVLDNCPYLFLRETVDFSSDESSFKNLTDKEIHEIVERLNSVYKHYKKNGFTEVIFSVIPNPVSVIYPSYDKYNDIIRRVQNHPDLIIPMINIYDKLDSAGCQVYHNSDSHWNNNGFNLWVNELNKFLRTVSKRKNQPS